ncbi:MAG: S66 peptidase family protein [Candidatus Micrarchaeia archaeon]
MYERIKPPALKPGSTIKIIVPSSMPGNMEGLSSAINFIKKQGFKVSLSTSLTHSTPHRFSSAGDSLRKTELENAFKNDEIDAIMALRGGSGSIDLLSTIDYDIIKEHPKIFIGYSDITLLQLAFYKKANLITFQGPMLIDLLEKDQNVLSYNWSTLIDIIKNGESLMLQNPSDSEWSKTITEGKSKGILLGGNMSMISLIANTAFMPKTDDSILFLEDVDIEPWVVDNILTSLVIKGLMKRVNGVFFGEFPHYGFENILNSSNDISFMLQNLFEENYLYSNIRDIITDVVTKKIKRVPSFLDFACCHGKYITTMPIGTRVEINAEEHTISMLESAVG